MTGSIDAFTAPGGELQKDIPVYIWTPAGFSSEQPLPILVANDGPEYANRSCLVAYIEQWIADKKILPHRLALVEPAKGERTNWYGASPAYIGALALSVIPELYARVRTVRPVTGMGASLGVLPFAGIMLQHPGIFDRFFWQSGSFFHRDFDPGPDHPDYREGDYEQIAKLTDGLRHNTQNGFNVQISMTCGIREQNLPGNRAIAWALAERDYPMQWHEVEGGHNFEAWGEACTPHLLDLLQPGFL